MTHPFPYGDKEMSYLRSSDAAMAQLIDWYEQIGERPERPVEENYFVSLIRAINDQLISLKAAASIWGRICEAFGNPPASVAMADASVESIKACGTTMKKAEYMHSIACMVETGELDLTALAAQPDKVVIERLTALRGIGLWTAEMLLIHSYERPDVMSYGDAAIRRGLCMLKGIEDPKTLTQDLFDELTKPYHPYGTVASIYLWRLSKEPAWPPAELAAQKGSIS